LYDLSSTPQALLDGLDEAQELLQAALRFRERYMKLSMQELCSTTQQILDGHKPPSAVFCSMSTQELSTKYTADGDFKRAWSRKRL